MGIKSFFKQFFKPAKASTVARTASGEIRVGKSAYAVASARWRLYKHNAALRRAGVWARQECCGRYPIGWLRPITNRKTPKPASYSNAGAGYRRSKRRELAAIKNGKRVKKAA